ncbi:DUF177 domain-containing protein [Streptococcus oricebi]|uniref:DUF177 domain-containing protein n=1 Tax=Streptococcus oricebi TaxID=1547447 RepID=A0ABS5B1Q6_9STRE|nr:DUF177 domain-containing protein [Streptococcus oricebi]MBP2622754.1 hypothetical protein [Streptococcus oricebi]
MLKIQEIRKNPAGLSFEQSFDLLSDLQERNREILDLKEVLATGKAGYEDGLYLLDYQLSYVITLASSRSMEPVELKESYLVQEVFVEEGNQKSQDLLDEELVMPLTGDEIDLQESVADNILLQIPLKVLTAQEEAEESLPSGQDWQVLSEEDYQRQQAAAREENNPFAGLKGLLDD